MTEAEHNDPRWYVVKYLGGRAGGGAENRDGWHVVRCCPCHFGESVSFPYPDRARAEIGLETILSVTPT